MLLVSTAIIVKNRNLVVIENNGNLESILKSKFQDAYSYLYDYKHLDIPFTSYSLVIPEIFKGSSVKIPSFKGSPEEILNSAISYVSSFDYDYGQGDPKAMLETGEGNCQAMSILLDTIMKNNDIISDIIIEGDHAYNMIKIGNKTYKVDISKGSINFEEVE